MLSACTSAKVPTCGQEAVWVQGVRQLGQSLLLRGACGIGHNGPHQVFQRGRHLVQPGSLQVESAIQLPQAGMIWLPLSGLRPESAICKHRQGLQAGVISLPLSGFKPESAMHEHLQGLQAAAVRLPQVGPNSLGVRASAGDAGQQEAR